MNRTSAWLAATVIVCTTAGCAALVGLTPPEGGDGGTNDAGDAAASAMPDAADAHQDATPDGDSNVDGGSSADSGSSADGASNDGSSADSAPAPDGDATADSSANLTDAPDGDAPPSCPPAGPTLAGNHEPTQITDGTGGCLQLPSGDATNGNLLDIGTCDADGLNQTWFVDTGGSIHFAPNPLKCVDFPAQHLVGNVPEDGSQLQIWDCNDHNGPDQGWLFTAANTIAFARAPTKCIESVAGGSASDIRMQTNDCDGTCGQTWFAVANSPLQTIQLQNGDGGCLEPQGAASTNGTLLELDPCSPTGQDQGWIWDGYGSLHYAPAPAQCLDIPGQDWSGTLPVDGTQLQIWACDQGISRDQWTALDPKNVIQVGSGESCIAAGDGGTADASTAVQIYPCDSKTEQTWYPRVIGSL